MAKAQQVRRNPHIVAQHPAVLHCASLGLTCARAGRGASGLAQQSPRAYLQYSGSW